MSQKVAIFGAGVAGLASAHFLVQRGFDVDVYETCSVPGGVAKSERDSETGSPTEYSWRAFGPWYKNTYDIMKQIPVQPMKSKKWTNVFDENLSPPIKFFLCADQEQKRPTNRWSSSGFSVVDTFKLSWLTLKVWLASPQRSQGQYAYMNAADEADKILSKKGSHTFKSVLGPFTGSDHKRVSVHHLTELFRKNFWPGPPAPYFHPDSVDKDHCSFTQGGFSGWLLLKRPSNESWFDPWVQYLQSKQVSFHFNHNLDRLEFENKQIVSAHVSDEKSKHALKIKADLYILAITPFATRDILATSNMLGMDRELDKFVPLVAEGEHIQISFRLGFSEKIIMVPRAYRENAVILVDSEFNITMFEQSRLWTKETDLGKGIKTLWSGTACADSVPGRLFGLPMKLLTRNQFDTEILFQIYKSGSLDQMVREANCGRSLDSFELIHFEVWHAWVFPTQDQAKQGVSVYGQQPKWVTTSKTQEFQPNFSTSFSNLFLAGAHTKTTADLYCMEAAVESGRKIADFLTSERTTRVQHMPAFVLPFQAIDTVLYRYNLPNIGPYLMLIFFVLMFSLGISAIVYATIRPKNINVPAIVFLIVAIVSSAIVFGLYWHRRRTIEKTNYS